MKNLTLILICLFLFSACKDSSSTTSTKSKTEKTKAKNDQSKIDNFDCASFFKKGDYSAICFIDEKLPEHGGSGCIIDFKTKGDKQLEDLKLQFTDKNSSSLAEMHFNLNKNNYKKGTITDVSNLGDAAFFDVHGTDLKSLSRSNKDLHVRYKNIVFVLFAEYMTNTDAPCFYGDDELIAFAKAIIENL